MAEGEEVAFTEAAEGVAVSAEVAELDRVSVEAHIPVAQAVLAGLLLARSVQAGLELTAIEHTVRDPMGCMAAEA